MTDRRWWKLNQHLLTPLLSMQRLGVLSDFDGTLSHLVNDPTKAVITPDNAHALQRLTQRVAAVALVSGRAIDDLQSRFPHPHVIYYGNHGLESERSKSEMAGWSKRIQVLLTELVLPDEPGLILEDKGVAVTVHFRATRNPAEIRWRLHEQLLPLVVHHGLKLDDGTNVWEIRPPTERNKGTAVREIVQRYKLDGVLYLGDDIGDIAAMRAVAALRAENTLASFCGVNVCSVPDRERVVETQLIGDVLADGPDDISQLLMWLVERL